MYWSNITFLFQPKHFKFLILLLFLILKFLKRLHLTWLHTHLCVHQWSTMYKCRGLHSGCRDNWHESQSVEFAWFYQPWVWIISSGMCMTVCRYEAILKYSFTSMLPYISNQCCFRSLVVKCKSSLNLRRLDSHSH